MKGIILAGGAGSRLYPNTQCVNKQLLPVYDKPMIYYPLSTLISAGIRDILIISDTLSMSRYQRLFGTGDFLGLNISYKVQKEPRGIAEALIIGESFIGNDPVALILGDNIFHSSKISIKLQEYKSNCGGALLFTYPVSDPERYGVIYVDSKGAAVEIIEKPDNPNTNLAVVGLYAYSSDVVDIAKAIKPSIRNELEITDVNNYYIKYDYSTIRCLGIGDVWLDAGTNKSLLQASNYVETIQERQGCMIGCIEEAALNMGFITTSQLQTTYDGMICNNDYCCYLKRLIYGEDNG